MIKPLLPILILFLHFIPSAYHKRDTIQDLSAFFKAGNSKEIAKYFSSSVELDIINEEEVYSKAQAEQILRDFFIKHKPSNTAVLHLIDTNPNYRFFILSLNTVNGKFRVSITLKKSDTLFFITELRIAPDKS